MRDSKSLVDLMMHGRDVSINPGNYPTDSQVILVFSTNNLKRELKKLNKQNIPLLTKTIMKREGSKYIVIEDCYKNPVEIRQIN
jgi:hypothetical protein